MTNGFLQLESMCFKNAFTSRYCTVVAKKKREMKIIPMYTLFKKKNSVKFIHVGFSSSRSNYLIFWQCDFYFNNMLAVYVAKTG
jgi:hypothetical protein